MAYASLSTRLGGLPDVLVGPVLRLVLADQVSVFFAFSKAVKVTLEVFASEMGGIGTNRVMVGTRSTVPLGTRFHVVCVTARGGPLAPHAGYFYDIKLGAHGNDAAGATGLGLFADRVVCAQGADARALLTYPQGRELPGFLFPTNDVNELRLLHGSCRKPHGPGPDALPIADEIIAESWTSPENRPQQLFLTGDQIYADDVAVQLLVLLQDAAAALGMPVEKLPTKDGDKFGGDFRPNRRKHVLQDQAGFTSGHGDSHLMTFAEFALMYAFAWSDVLWPDTLPTFAEAMPAEYAQWKPDKDYADQHWATTSQKNVRHRDTEEAIRKQQPELQAYRATLAQVRRALANTPTLMIFDDHEITDDWNFNLKWIRRVSDPAPPASKPTALGRAVLRNGLAAYAIFQAWGNTPGQFRPDHAGDAGTKLLTNIASWDGRSSGPAVTAIASSVGLPIGFSAKKAVKPPASLVWHYAHQWPAHQVVALDTRTERGAPAHAGAPPALIYDIATVKAMVGRAPAPGPEELVIVIAPGPVFGVPLHEGIGRAAYIGWPFYSAFPGFDPEHWTLEPGAREQLLAALMARAATGADGVRRGRVVMLGGDVHHGSAVHVRYHATKPFGQTPGATEGALAQLTSSACKNQSKETKAIEHVGYMAHDQRGVLLPPGSLFLTEIFGFENPGGNAKHVGSESWDIPGSRHIRQIYVEGEPATYECTTLVPYRDGQAAIPATSYYNLMETPTWRYEVRPQRGVRVGRASPATIAASAASRDDKVRRAIAAADQHRRFSYDVGVGQDVVGHNNLGDIAFIWNAGEDKRVIQNLWWRLEATTDAAPLTRYELPLRTTGP